MNFTEIPESKIKTVRVENMLRVRFAFISFEGDRVVLGGENGEGKTSIARSIFMAFGGGRAIPERAVHGDAPYGEVEIELDSDYVINLRVNAGGKNELELRNKEGGKYKRPQELLDGFNARYGFYPEDFLTAAAKEQVTILKQALAIDTTSLDMKRTAFFDKRSEVNRVKKEYEGQLAGVKLTAGVPEEEQTAADVLARVKNAAEQREKQADIERKLRDEERMINFSGDSIRAARAEIAALNAIIERHEATVLNAEEKQKVLRDNLSAIEIPDVADAEQELKRIEETNLKVRANKSWKNLRAKVSAFEEQAQKLTNDIEGIDAEKAKMISERQLPVPGLVLTEDGLLFEGYPFDQASEAKRWTVAIALGFARNPKLKLVYVKQGSLLDRKRWALVERIVEQYGGQLLADVVGDSEFVTVLMEDGVVKEDRTSHATKDGE